MEKQARVEYYSKLKSTKVNWLWYPYIPYGKITIIQGDPGEGKTSLALYIAMLLSQGKPLLFSLQSDTLCNWRYAESVGNVECSMIELCEQALKQLVGAEGIGSREAFDAM